MRASPSARVAFALGITAAMLAGGCGSKPSHDAPPSDSSTTPTSIANPNGEVSRSIGEIKVTATPSPGSQADLEIAEGSVPPGKAFEAQAAASAAVRLTNQSGGQPSAPITLRFDLSNDPALANEFSETVKPVVRSLSADNSQAIDLLAATWDPATRTVTATTPHLSIFQVIAVNVANVWNTATAALKQAVGETDSQCRDKSEITIDGTKLALTPSKAGPVAGCLREGDGKAVAVDFTNGTHHYFSVISTPAGQFTNPVMIGSDDVIATWLHQSSDSSAGLLTPTSTGELVLPSSTISAQIHLDIDPVSLQLKTLLTGLGMLGVDGDAVIKTLMASKDGWDCIATAGKVAASPAPGSVDEFRNTLGDIAQCGLAISERAVGDSKNYVLHRMSVAVSLLTTLPDQLLANVTGAIGELTGDNHLIFTLASETTGNPRDSSPAKSVIDRINITTWAYDRVQGDTYKADNNGGKKIEVFWKSFAGADQVRSGCTSTVRIEGPGIDEIKEESNCDSYDPGTYLDVRSPGEYTVTVTVRQDGQPDVSAQRTVTILPH